MAADGRGAGQTWAGQGRAHHEHDGAVGEAVELVDGAQDAHHEAAEHTHEPAPHSTALHLNRKVY